MAEEENQNQTQAETDAPPGRKTLRPVLLLLGVVAVSAGAGFGVASMMGGPDTTLAEEITAEKQPAPQGREGKFEYVEFKTVTVNLDTENLARYLRVTLALAIEDTDGKDAVRDTIERNIPELESRLRVYLAGKTLDDVRGKENQNRIISEIYDMFNGYLWPSAKPMISHVLLRDFILQ